LPAAAVLLGGMQTETAGAATLVWLAVVVMDRNTAPEGADRACTESASGTRRLACGALLFGLLCALKPVHAIAAMPLLAWAALRHRGAWRHPLALAGSALLAAAIGGSSYAYAWALTGNPVLPLLNQVFHSPYFAP